LKNIRGLKASLTVEAAFVTPMVIGCLILVMYMGFYLRDRAVLSSMAAETAFWASHEKRFGRSIDESEMINYYNGIRTRGTFFFRTGAFSGNIGKSRVSVSLEAERPAFSLPLLNGIKTDYICKAEETSESVSVRPERRIRLLRNLKELKGKIGDREAANEDGIQE